MARRKNNNNNKSNKSVRNQTDLSDSKKVKWMHAFQINGFTILHWSDWLQILTVLERIHHVVTFNSRSPYNYVQTESFGRFAHFCECNLKKKAMQNKGVRKLFNVSWIKNKELCSCRQKDKFTPHAISLMGVPSSNTQLTFNMPLYLKDDQQILLLGHFNVQMIKSVNSTPLQDVSYSGSCNESSTLLMMATLQCQYNADLLASNLITRQPGCGENDSITRATN